MTLISSFICLTTYAQKAELKLVDSSTFVTKLKYYSDEHLHTAAGAIPFSTISSVRFNSKDRKKATFFLEKLDSMGIRVIFNEDPITTIEEKIRSSPKLADSLSLSSQPPPVVAIFGLGGGLDYGGLGVRGGLPLTQHVVLFGGAGYALAGVGYNGGVMVIVKPKADLSFTMSAMYGYNGALTIDATPRINQLYYGPSVAAGARYLVGKGQTNFWHVSVIFPVRDSEFHRTADFYGAQYFPILISMGFNFGIKRQGHKVH